MLAIDSITIAPSSTLALGSENNEQDVKLLFKQNKAAITYMPTPLREDATSI